jgi:putative SOS response-associated peptidase YedK
VLEKRFRVSARQIALFPRYNLAPGQEAPVVVVEESRLLKMMKWGLVPFWAKDASIGDRMINARADTVAEKPSFKQALRQRRCLVLADGFFEWQRRPGQKKKVPVRFALKSGEPFAFAGLWERWKAPDGNVLHSFTIITTEANELVQPIHHRMPVILRAEQEQRWLDPNLRDVAALADLWNPYPSQGLTRYEVSTIVNSPANDVPECILPVKGDSV